jgi:uncharacterized linocin/CFP29 family protein
MDLLKRHLAPILPEAWSQIDDEARRVLKLGLAGRKVVDFDGPHGWEHAALNVGRLVLHEKELVAGVRVGTRVVQPLIEIRAPFALDVLEIDSVGRGAKELDLEPVVEVSERVARAEDDAIFNGSPEAGIRGIIESSPHSPVDLPGDPAGYPRAIVEALEVLREAAVAGPYGLVLGPRWYKQVSEASEDGYPIRKRIERQIIDGPLVWASSVEGAVLLSLRGGDFTLTVGQDLSIGYASHDREKVELYLTESFTFRVHDGAAAVYLKPPLVV